jgi:phytol kinase
MNLILVLLIVFALLVANEAWWRRRRTHDEFSRKFIHITVGSFVAFWPFLLSWRQIQLLSVAFVCVVLVSKYFKVFQAIHSVQRPTWGELFFAASVGIIATLTNDAWVYAAALLQMSLADGMAAIIGVQYGLKGRGRYTVFGATKTVIGSCTFFITSFIILAIFKQIAEPPLSLSLIAGISLIATALVVVLLLLHL